MKTPPPDHMIPYSWLEKSGVSQLEIDNWTLNGTIVRVNIHGGASFVYFAGQSKPVKFREVTGMIKKAREDNHGK